MIPFVESQGAIPQAVNEAPIVLGVPDKNKATENIPKSTEIKTKPVENAEKSSTDKSVKKTREVRVLPLLNFYDVDGDAVYNWWYEAKSESRDARQLSKVLSAILSTENGKILNFINPYKSETPLIFHSTNLQKEDYEKLKKWSGAELFLTGDVIFDASPTKKKGKRLKVHIDILQAPSFRKIAEVFRVYDVYAGDFVKLVELGESAWPDLRSAIETSLYSYKPQNNGVRSIELVVSGAMSFQDLETLKQDLRTLIPGVKSLTERSLEGDSAGMFVEFEGDTPAFTQALKQSRLEGFMTQVVSSSATTVMFDVRPISKLK